MRKSLSQLASGTYTGKVSGVFADGASYGIKVWRTERGVFGLLGRSHCQVTALTNEDVLNCGDLTLRLTLNEIRGNSVTGLAQDLTWGPLGAWTIERDQ